MSASTETGDALDLRGWLIAFDFDGTIADSLPQVVASYNAVASGLGLRSVTDAEVPALRAMEPTAILRQVGVPMWKLPRLLLVVRAEIKRRIDDVQPIEGVVDALRSLACQGCTLALLTSNGTDSVARFSERHGLPRFEHVIAEVGLFDKAKALRRLLSWHKAEDGRVAYVADEVRDVEAARKVGIVSVAVGWGYNTTAALLEARPDVMVDEPGELVERVGEIGRRGA